MHKQPKHFLRLGLVALGAALACAAGFVPGATIECAVLGQASGALAWGPTLFRALLILHGSMLAFVGIWTGKRRAMAEAEGLPVSETNIGSSEKANWHPWFALSLLSALALGLRLWHLNSCLWYDEVVTLLDFVRPQLGTIVTSFNSQNQHMLYSILAHGAIRGFGESAWALRLPAVLFGVASLWALFLLGRRVVGTLEALLACTSMTVSYHHIWFSQNARGYTGLLFFATLATWLWLEAFSRNTWGWWILYAVASALGFWVHMTMAFVILAHGFLYLIVLVHAPWPSARGTVRGRNTGVLWRPILAWLLCGSLTLQVYALAMPQFFHTALQEGVATKTEWTKPLWVVREGLRGLEIGWLGGTAVLFGGILAAVGWLGIFRRDWHAAMIMILPAILGGGTMLALGHPLWPRFFFFSTGFALLIVVHGAMTLPSVLLAPMRGWPFPERLAKPFGLALACSMIAASIATVPRCYALPKQDFTGARAYIEENRKVGDAVVAVGLAGTAYSRYFASNWLVARAPAELDAVRRVHPRVWLVYTIPIQLEACCPELWQKIRADFEVVKTFPGTLGDGTIFVCREETEKNSLGDRAIEPPEDQGRDARRASRL